MLFPLPDAFPTKSCPLTPSCLQALLKSHRTCQELLDQPPTCLTYRDPCPAANVLTGFLASVHFCPLSPRTLPIHIPSNLNTAWTLNKYLINIASLINHSRASAHLVPMS